MEQPEATFVPTVRHDVFICHAHGDDNPRGSGWVSLFKKDLENALRARLGFVNVFMDDELSPDDKYRGKLQDAVKGSALFVPVISPSLLLSEFCNEELSWFRRAPRVALGSEHASLVFKVVLLRDLDGNYRYWVRGVTDVSFYLCLQKVDRILKQGTEEYAAQMDYLAGSIAYRLQDLKTKFAAVFVVKFSNLSLGDEIKVLENELQGDGHRLLPGVYIPDFGEARGRLHAWIKDSKFCVFILGSEYQPEITDLLDFARENKKRSVFWIGTKEYEKRSSEQGRFISKLESDGLELHVGNLAHGVYDRLKSDHENASYPLPANTSRLESKIRLYVISDSKGPRLEKAFQLAEQITKENREQPTPVQLKPFQLVSPSEGLPSEFVRQHEELLSSCDAVLIDWDRGDKYWLRDTWREVLDRKSDGRARYKSAAIFTSKPDDEARKDVLKDLGAFEDVIGKPNPDLRKGDTSAMRSPTSEGEGPSTKSLFDPGRLRRFLSSLTDDAG
jgi:hypothetical protein